LGDVTASVGLAALGELDADAPSVLAAAHQSMYGARRAGGDRAALAA
jgi:GGDEF domain-containing protein